MIEYLLGSLSKERILTFLTARKEGYAREISLFYNTNLSPIQIQLDNMEKDGVLVSKSVGKTKLFVFNPRYPFRKELIALIEKSISFLPESEKEKLLIIRRRPRRKHKPLW